MKLAETTNLPNRIIRPGYIILALVAVFFGRRMFVINGDFIGGIDVKLYFFWHAQFIKEQFLSGNLPLWNPYYYSGHPFIANPQTFVFYPFTLLFLALPASWAFNIDLLAHVYLAAMGAYFFIFMITKSKAASLTGAIVYSFSGYFMDNIYAGHLTMVHTAALLPWIFYFFEKALRSQKILLFGASGLIFGLQILSGEPQNSFYTGFFLGVYFLVRLLFSRPYPTINTIIKSAIRSLLIPVVAFCLSAVQILPSLEFMSLSDRAGNAYDFATYLSFHPSLFFTFLAPRLSEHFVDPLHGSVSPWEYAAYLGIISIILAGIGATLSKYRCFSRSLVLIVIITITIILGGYTPIYWLYYKFVPGFSTFRFPTRCVVILVFAMAVLAGLGVQRLTELNLKKKHHNIATIGMGILIACLLGGAMLFNVPLTSKEMVLALCLGTTAFVILYCLRFIKNANIIGAILIIALFGDLYLTYSHRIPELNQNKLSQKNRHEYMFGRQGEFGRVYLPNDVLRGMKFHYYTSNGYTPIVLNNYYRFVHEMAGLDVPTLNRHTLSKAMSRGNLAFSSKILGIKYAVAMTDSGYKLLKSPTKVMPQAVLVNNAKIVPDLDEHIRYLKEADFDPQKQVLLEKEAPGHTLPQPKTADSGQVTITEYHPNRIELEAVSQTNTYLVLSELFYPGWHAYIDNKEVPILKADFLLRAIPLTAGRHSIVFTYRPMSFIVGAAISLTTLLLTICALLFGGIRKLRPQQTAN